MGKLPDLAWFGIELIKLSYFQFLSLKKTNKAYIFPKSSSQIWTTWHFWECSKLWNVLLFPWQYSTPTPTNPYTAPHCHLPFPLTCSDDSRGSKNNGNISWKDWEDSWCFEHCLRHVCLFLITPDRADLLHLLQHISRLFGLPKVSEGWRFLIWLLGILETTCPMTLPQPS